MTEMPEWFHDAPDFDPSRPWQAVVCSGGKGALSHPLEPIGLHYQRGPGANDWAISPRQRREGKTVYSVTPGRRGRPQEPMVAYIGYLGVSGVPIVTDCPVCRQSHRVKRAKWRKFLDDARVSGEPWADVSDLD